MVPGNGLQAIMAGLENHGRLDRLTLDRIERDRDLVAGIDPVAKQSGSAIPGIFCNRSCTIPAQAQVHGRTGEVGKIDAGEP